MSEIVKRVDSYPTEERRKLYSYDSKYYQLVRMIHQHLPGLEINEIQKVQNSFLKAQYLLKKEEYKIRYGDVEEHLMLHCTSVSCAGEITRDNFDWRHVKRGKYGYGTSFSPDADYANCHANRRLGDSRAFVVTKVMMSKKAIGSYNRIPKGNYDTTTDKNDKVYVKYHDHEFLPKYIIYYSGAEMCMQQSKYY